VADDPWAGFKTVGRVGEAPKQDDPWAGFQDTGRRVGELPSTGDPVKDAFNTSVDQTAQTERANPQLATRLQRRARLQSVGEAPNFTRNGPDSSFNEKGSLVPGAPVSDDFKDGPGAAGTWGLETAYTIGAAPLIEAGNAGYDALTGRGSFGDRYGHYQKKFDVLRDIGNEEHPYAGWAGTGTGIAGALLAPELKLAGAGTAGNAMLNGLVYGGLFGIGNPGSFGEAARNVGLGAVLGAGLGATAGKGAQMLENRLANRAAARASRIDYDNRLAPIADELGLGDPATGGVRPYEAGREIPGYAFADEAPVGGRGPWAQGVAERVNEARPGAIAGAVGKLNETIAGGHNAYGSAREAAEAVQNAVRNTVEGDTAGMTAGLGRMGDQLGGGQRLVNNRADLGELVTDAVQARQAASKQGVNAAYENAASKEGTFEASGVSRVSQAVRNSLENGPGGPVPINSATPRTAEALSYLDDVAAMRAPVSGNGAPQGAAAITLNGMERVRQRLLALARQAKQSRVQNPSDHFAMNRVITAYEDHIDDMIQNGLFRGDPEAIPAWKAARAARRQHGDLYSPRGHDGRLTEAGKALNKIINEDRDPTEVARYILGTSAVGDSTTAMQLVNHLRDILGPASPEFAAIKQAAWNELTRLGQNAANVTHKDASKIADRIDEMLSNKGRAFANALFDENERAALKSVSSGLRSLSAKGGSPEAIKQLTQIASRDLSPETVAKMLTGGDNAIASKETLPTLRAIKAVYGKDSPQWSAVRQTMIRQLLPIDQNMGPQHMATRIRQFLAKNQTVAQEVFTKAELAKIKGLGDILDRMVPPKSAVNNSNTFNKALRAAMRRIGELAGMAGWVTGDLTTLASSWAAGTAYRVGKDVLNGQTARQLYEGAAPMLPTRVLRATGRGLEKVAAPVSRETYRGLGPGVANTSPAINTNLFGSASAAADEEE
jgi:hypothetical protein